MDGRPLKLAILQRVCSNYRLALFRKLSSEPGVEAKLFFGDINPKTKDKGSSSQEGVNCQRLATFHFQLGRRHLTWHSGLISALREFKPDVILCEGESHFLGYLQALFYRRVCDKKVGLIHWCFISLPGRPLKERNIRTPIKGFFRKFFDAFLLYSSYSKERLIELGQPEEKLFVATNVGDVKKFLSMSDSLPDSPSEARRKLGLADRFTALYVGTLDAVKRPETMLDLAKSFGKRGCNFVLAGSGPLLEPLRERATREKLEGVHLPGRVAEQLPLYYRSADVLVIPGRGGVVISEAMAFGVPSIVYQADGTEYDLIEDKVTGFHLKRPELRCFEESIEFLLADPERCKTMRAACRRLVEEKFTTANMAERIIAAARYALKSRSGRV